MSWECVIGLEIHAQLKTQSKIFSPDSTKFEGEENVHVHPVSLGLPGSLPVLNKEVVEYAIRTGLALNCKIESQSVFARKNYFYPDLPKGYQISQHKKPICSNGWVEFLDPNKKMKKIHIERAHLEEDAGKSLHRGSHTLVNFNRAGVPLLEIVSNPELETPEEAALYARTICNILKYIDVCDGNLEEGSLRCDCNISVRKKGVQKLGTRVELKNLNSFRFIIKALEYEKERQIHTLESGKSIFLETRLYDSQKNKTFSMREKEESHDYRYFPDPDLPPLYVDEKWLKNIQKELPELPLEKSLRFEKDYQIPAYDASVLTQEKSIALFFEEVAKASQNPKASSNWIMGDVLKKLNEEKKTMEENPLKSEHLSSLIQLIDKKTISGKMAKTIFEDMWKTGKAPEVLVKEQNMVQITDEKELKKIIQKVLDESPSQVKQYKQGKTKIFGFFVGQVMKNSKGQASPEGVQRILKELLKS